MSLLENTNLRRNKRNQFSKNEKGKIEKKSNVKQFSDDVESS